MSHIATHPIAHASWLRRHPLLSYFAIAFGLSWGGIGCVLAATGFNLAMPRPIETTLFFVAMLLGPSVSGLILTARLDGRRGLRELCLRLLRWRIDFRWYAVALLTVPLLLLAVLWSLSAVAGPAYQPHFQGALLAAGLIAGSFEEIGWTGFVTPRLLAHHGVGKAGMRLGLVWALWGTRRSCFSTLSARWAMPGSGRSSSSISPP
jgi:membrane protease YdiL (CAAX protease family)